MTSIAPLQTGSLIDGRYRIDDVIGEGGFGRVFRGVHLILEAPIAIKTLRLDIGGDEAERSLRFLDEARLLSKLRHPNIVRVIDAGVHPSTPPQGWLVIEWCDGVTLGDELAETTGSARSVREVWELLGPLVDAVATAHEANIVHRDIKPSNVMITRGPKGSEARLIDFGIAKAVSQGEEQPSASRTSGRVAFTTAYAAPEQLAGSRTGPWTDVHALALILTEVLTGEPPYARGQELHAILDQIERPTPGRFGVEVGRWEAVLARAVMFKSSDRFQSARELHEALAATLPDLAHDRTSSISDSGVARARSHSANRSGATEREPARSNAQPLAKKNHDPSTITAAASSREVATSPSLGAPRRVVPKAAWALPMLLAGGVAAWAVLRGPGNEPLAGPRATASESNAVASAQPEGDVTGAPMNPAPTVRTVDVPTPQSPTASAAVSPTVAASNGPPVARPSATIRATGAASTAVITTAAPPTTAAPTTTVKPTLQ